MAGAQFRREDFGNERLVVGWVIQPGMCHVFIIFLEHA